MYCMCHSSPGSASDLAASTEILVAFDLGLQRSMRFLTCPFQARMPKMLSWITWRWGRKRMEGRMNVSCCLSNFLLGKISLLLLKQELNPKSEHGEVPDTFQRRYAFYLNIYAFFVMLKLGPT